jgi:hypothetical protein
MPPYCPWAVRRLGARRFVPDLVGSFCHPYFMIFESVESVTPMHHLMIMDSAAASAERR